MRLFELLSEAPISDYQTFGDFDRSSSFRDKRDRHLVTNPNAIKRTKSKFLNTDHELNFYFVNSPAANRHTEVGLVELDWVRENIGDEVADAIEPVQHDGINFVFTNNKGAERFMMTPWIMAHRMAHSLQRMDFGIRSRYQNEQFRSAHELLVSSLLHILEYGYNVRSLPDDIKGVETNRRAQLILKHFAQQVCTFRSARDGKIRDWFEVVNEMFAQWATTGEIKFNTPPIMIKLGMAGTARLTDQSDVTDLLDMLGRDMDTLFDDALSVAYGHIYVM